MPDSVEKVKLDLIEAFTEKIRGSAYFEDFAKIGSYLSDPNQYRHGLEQLHADMEQRFNSQLDVLMNDDPVLKKLYPNWRDGLRQFIRGIYSENFGLRRGTVDRKKFSLDWIAIQAYRKILTDSLKANELKNGFHLGKSDDKSDILIGFPDEVVEGKSEFNTFLREKKVFKDLSAGREHGENSHRIQWYLITKIGTLAHSASEIYSKLPGWRTPTGKPRSFFLWEFLVDRDGVPTNASSIPFKTLDETDFRAPSNVNRCLKDGKVFPRLDLLINVLSERWGRRTGHQPGDYLAKKLFPPEALKELSIETRDFLWDQVKSRVVHEGETIQQPGKYRIFKR